MKLKYLVFSILCAAFLSSAIQADRSLKVGMTAPDIETTLGTIVGNDENPNKITKVISFWSPKDPASRINNKNLSRIYGSDTDNKTEFISICTDTDESLGIEVMKIDDVKADLSFQASQIGRRVLKDYGADKSHKAFKISPDGKIIEII